MLPLLVDVQTSLCYAPTIMDMHTGLRGPKPSIAYVGCPDEEFKHFNKADTVNIVSNGTYPTKSGRLHATTT